MNSKESLPSYPDDNGTDAGINDPTDPEIPVYAPDSERLTPEESTTISEQWETLKESLTWQDVILHPVARLGLFFNEDALGKADQQYLEWKQEEQEILQSMENTEKSVQNSDKISEVLQAVQASADITPDTNKYGADRRQAALEQAGVFQNTRRENLEFVSAKIRAIEEKKKFYEEGRDLARKVFIDSYAGKVVVEKALVEQQGEHIVVAEAQKNECLNKAEKLREAREFLEQFTAEQLLTYDADELQETIGKLSFKENEALAQAEEYEEQVKVLEEKRKGTLATQAFWEAKIAPKKSGDSLDDDKEESTANSAQPDAKTSDAPLEAKQSVASAQQESALFDIREGESKKEKKNFPDTIPAGIIGFRKEVWEAGQEELTDLDSVLQDARATYAEKHPESRLFDWVLWTLEFFVNTDPKKKTSK